MKIPKLKFIGKVLLVVIFPVVISFWLYPFSEKIIFSGREYQQHEFTLENLFQKKPTLRNLIADIFSVPLFLDWYRVSIINNSTGKNPDCLEAEPPTVFFTFIKGDPRLYYSTLTETTVETGFYSNSGPGHPRYYLKSGKSAYFIAPSWEDYSINGGLMFGGDCKLGMPLLTNNDTTLGNLSFDYDISIKPYWVSWVVRFAIIFVFWIFLLSSVIAIRDWLKR